MDKFNLYLLDFFKDKNDFFRDWDWDKIEEDYLKWRHYIF